LTFFTIAKLIVIEHSIHQLLILHLHKFHITTYLFNDRRQSSMLDVTQIKKWPESILSYAVTSFSAKLHSFNSFINTLLVRASNYYNTSSSKLLSDACTQVHTLYTEYVSLCSTNGKARSEISTSASGKDYRLLNQIRLRLETMSERVDTFNQLPLWLNSK
jgi:hypothetical protein